MIDDRLEKLMSQADTAGVETSAVTAEIRQIIAALRIDPEFFIEFFLAEQLDMSVPEFHCEIWGLLTDVEKERVLLAIPRDHAKTTLAKLVVVWYWLFTEHRFCAYLSNTNPIAKGACKDIIEFMHCDNFVAVFGKIEMVKSSENESLWVFNLRMPNSNRIKRCMLRAVGQGQQMRGINIDNQRPDITVIDDVEDNENTESEHQQKKLDRWMFGPFLKALARRKKIIWLGNMLSKTSLLARLSRSPKWNPVVFGCLVKDKVTGVLRPLWPDKWSIEALREDLAEYKTLGLLESWMCEMMNMPGHGENGFTADQICYRPLPTPDQCIATFITIDPAFGLQAHNDETCIAVHAITDDGPMTVAAIHGKGDENWMFRETLNLAYYWGAWTWGIESVAAQRLLFGIFRLLLAGMGMNHPIEMVPLLAGKGDPKISRIRAWVSLMSGGDWAIPEGDFDITTQLLEIDTKKKDNKDDIVDACAYGPAMMESYLNIIMSQARGEDVLSSVGAQFGTEVAGV